MMRVQMPPDLPPELSIDHQKVRIWNYYWTKAMNVGRGEHIKPFQMNLTPDETNKITELENLHEQYEQHLKQLAALESNPNPKSKDIKTIEKLKTASYKILKILHDYHHDKHGYFDWIIHNYSPKYMTHNNDVKTGGKHTKLTLSNTYRGRRRRASQRRHTRYSKKVIRH